MQYKHFFFKNFLLFIFMEHMRRDGLGKNIAQNAWHPLLNIEETAWWHKAKWQCHVIICDHRMNINKYINYWKMHWYHCLLRYSVLPARKLLHSIRIMCHATKSKWFQNIDVDILEEPAQLQDLKPSEHLWPILKHSIRTHSICQKKTQQPHQVRVEQHKLKSEQEISWLYAKKDSSRN